MQSSYIWHGDPPSSSSDVHDDYILDAVYYIGRTTQGHYVLFCNHRILYVQVALSIQDFPSPRMKKERAEPTDSNICLCPPNKQEAPRVFQADLAESFFDDIPEEDPTYGPSMQIIQSLLRSIRHGNNSMVCLVKSHKYGDYRPIYRKMKYPPLRHSVWAPLVRLSDIRHTKWHDVSRREGVWDGKEVDLFIYDGNRLAYDIMVQDESEGQKLLRDTGLSHLAFKMLAHVVDDDGETILGIMREPDGGRGVEYRDKAAVYDAVAALQSKRILHRGLSDQSIVISPHGVRFNNISSLLQYSPDQVDELEEEAQWFHWKKLQTLFNALRKTSDHGWALILRRWRTVAMMVPSFPSPNEHVHISLEKVLRAASPSIPHRVLSRARAKNEDIVTKQEDDVKAEPCGAGIVWASQDVVKRESPLFADLPWDGGKRNRPRASSNYDVVMRVSARNRYRSPWENSSAPSRLSEASE